MGYLKLTRRLDIPKETKDLINKYMEDRIKEHEKVRQSAEEQQERMSGLFGTLKQGANAINVVKHTTNGINALRRPSFVGKETEVSDTEEEEEESVPVSNHVLDDKVAIQTNSDNKPPPPIDDEKPTAEELLSRVMGTKKVD